MRPLSVLVVDDERPALDELTYLLERDDRIGTVHACTSAAEGLRTLQECDVDAAFLDVQMPGLDGLELAAVLSRFRVPPRVVFVTAHEEHALGAFDVRAVDFVLKPVSPARLAEAVRRVVDGGEHAAEDSDPQVPVERSGVTRFVRRSEITHVEAHGDYARLHTGSGAHLVRLPLTQLEQEWSAAGFHRIHRSMLVSMAHVTELRMDSGHCTLVVAGGAELAVSRRHTRELRDLLLRRSER